MMAQVLFFNGFFQKDPHLNAVEQGFFFQVSPQPAMESAF